MLNYVQFQNDQLLNDLRRGLNVNNLANASQLIVNTLADIVKLQTKYETCNSKRTFLNRGIEKCTILEVDNDIQNIVWKLFNNPHYDKESILRFQHQMYSDIMKIEMGCLEREMTKLNELAAKRKRFLRSICNDELFKKCNNFLIFKKSSEIIKISRVNESLWKVAVDNKIGQTELLNVWLRTVSSVHDNCEYADPPVLRESISITNLSFSRNECVDISPDSNLKDLLETPITPEDLILLDDLNVVGDTSNVNERNRDDLPTIATPLTIDCDTRNDAVYENDETAKSTNLRQCDKNERVGIPCKAMKRNVSHPGKTDRDAILSNKPNEDPKLERRQLSSMNDLRDIRTINLFGNDPPNRNASRRNTSYRNDFFNNQRRDRLQRRFNDENSNSRDSCDYHVPNERRLIDEGMYGSVLNQRRNQMRNRDYRKRFQY